MRLDLADHILTPVAHRDHARSGGLCGPGRNGEDCATILNSLQTLPPFIPTNSKLKYSTLVTAETSLQFCAVLRSSAQFCAVLRSLQLADPDLAVLRSSNVQPRGHPVLTPSCSSGASQTPLTSCNQNVAQTTFRWSLCYSQRTTSLVPIRRQYRQEIDRSRNQRRTIETRTDGSRKATAGLRRPSRSRVSLDGTSADLRLRLQGSAKLGEWYHTPCAE